MEYTVVITRENSHWRAVAKDLPECVAEASTRDEAISMIKSQIAEASQRVEVLKVEVPESLNGQQALNGAKAVQPGPEMQKPGSIWTYYGVFKDDPTWGEMFDEIERQRDQRMAGE